MAFTVELDLAGRTLRLETGRVAKQADGCIWASYGDTVVLATAVASQNAKPGVDFLPLTVDYQEKAYAAGKIPGGYFKREGRPSEKEVLTSRLIDPPLRPFFREGYYFGTQVIGSQACHVAFAFSVTRSADNFAGEVISANSIVSCS